MNRHPSGFVGLVAVCAAFAATASADGITVKLNEQYGHLKNGVKVILLPDQSTQLVEVDVRYAVGSKEDPPGKGGLAHLVEHLFFQQRQAGPDQPSIGAVLRQSSVEFNAHTTWDYTHYNTLARAEDLPTVVAIEGLRLATGCATITKEVFEREREVVRNEIRQRDGGPEGRMLWKLHELVYGSAHPYGRSIGGSDAEIASLTLEDACAFVHDHYVPERATVAVAGNFEPAKLQPLLGQHFGAIPARAAKPVVAVTPVAAARRNLTVDVDIERPMLVVAWPMPPTYGKDAFATAFIDGVVYGRLYWAFHDFADDVQVVHLGGERAPVLAVELTLKKGESPESAASQVIKQADDAHFGLADLNKLEARAGLIGDLAGELETLGDRAETYTNYAQFDPGVDFAGQVKRLQEFDGSQLKEVVRETLQRDHAVVITLKPTKATGGAPLQSLPSVAEVTRDELPVDARDAARPIALPPGPTAMAGARRFQLENGFKVLLLPTSAPLPAVTVRLSFAVGAAHEPPSSRGLATLAAILSVGTFGSSRYSFDFDVEPDATHFTTHASSLYVNDIIKAMEVAGDSIFPARAPLMRDVKKALRRARARERARKLVSVNGLIGKAVYGEAHPYSFAFDPLIGADSDASASDAIDFIEHNYRAANATLVVTGVFDAADVEKRLRAALADWKRGTPATPVTAPAQRGKEAVILGIAGRDDESLVDVNVAWTVPGGMGAGYAARLVLVEMLDRRVASVREKLGVSYGMYAAYRPTVAPALLVVRGGVDSQRAGVALAAARGAIDEVRRGDGFLEDFVRARATVLGRVVGMSNDSRTLARRLSQAELFGLPPSFYDQLAKEVANLGPREVLDVARRELDPAKEVDVCEGPRPVLTKMFDEVKLKAKIVDMAK